MNDFPAIPLLEHRPYDRIRELYLYLEPSLMAAIRRQDMGEARRLINQVLVHIYSAGEERSDLLKGLLLELVVAMSRAAVEAGAGQTEVLGINFRSITRLADIDDDEQLTEWLSETIEHIMETIAATEASNRFGKLLDLALQEPVTIEKKGRQVAVILSVEEYNRMESAIEGLQDQRLRESIADMDAGKVMPAAEVFASLKQRYK